MIPKLILYNSVKKLFNLSLVNRRIPYFALGGPYNKPFPYFTCFSFPHSLTMKHLCITQCTYWTPLSATAISIQHHSPQAELIVPPLADCHHTFSGARRETWNGIPIGLPHFVK